MVSSKGVHQVHIRLIRPIQSNPTQNLWVHELYVSLIELKFPKIFSIIRVVGSTIDKLIEPKPVDY